MSGARRWRSLFFAPANRLDLVRKFPRWAADVSVMDLEDGTPDAQKEAARHVAEQAAREVRPALKGQLYLRVNQPESRHFAEDLLLAAGLPVDGVVVPKVERPDQLLFAQDLLAARRPPGQGPLSIIVGIESAWGVERASQLAGAAPVAVAVYFGAEDYAADLGAERTAAGTEVLYARSRVALAARLAALAGLDQAVTEIRDDQRFRDDAQVGRQLGYRGKICVHPRQVALAHEAFAPSEVAVAWSRRLLAQYETAAASGRGTIEFEGQMVDGPLLSRARQVLAAAGAEEGGGQ